MIYHQINSCPDKQVHQADGWTNYSTFSLWDTYRAAHPLYTYSEPQRVNDLSLIHIYLSALLMLCKLALDK